MAATQYDLVVVGAGPTAFGALTRFEELRRQGVVKKEARILLIDREAEPGGLARTLQDENGFSWDLGVHVTGASRFSAFLQMLDTVIEDWNILPRQVLADISHLVNAPRGSKDNYAPYPVQNYINYFPEALKNRCLAELEKANQQNNNNGAEETAFDNFGTFSQNHFGSTLQDVFIRPYNEK
ncbi:unnamed protein product [Bursaphelenchus xylophilus]|uniref:(pine wood nematode) hypothetical protein n=1 Tax=Bursaphelenchus xylophilus TaxID=6326 RepID=A0A1I7SA02_BURXY|nr:unnamed protein product [Bursaphelenchus xylophilus]CAG9126095.1 unnamed protein product [Bursaphelenchus xylophilus]